MFYPGKESAWLFKSLIPSFKQGADKDHSAFMDVEMLPNKFLRFLFYNVNSHLSLYPQKRICWTAGVESEDHMSQEIVAVPANGLLPWPQDVCNASHSQAPWFFYQL